MVQRIMMQLETLNVWPTTFYTVQNEDAEAQKVALMRLCYRRRAEGKRWGITEQLKHDLYESEPNLLEEPEAKPLMAFFNASIKAIVNDRRLQGVGYECWCHITNNGGFHSTHAHQEIIPGRGICGIYCVNAGQSDRHNGAVQFYSPNIYESPDIMNFMPFDGRLILFSGYLRHSTVPYRGADDRVVIAFNATYDMARS